MERAMFNVVAATATECESPIIDKDISKPRSPAEVDYCSVVSGELRMAQSNIRGGVEVDPVVGVANTQVVQIDCIRVASEVDEFAIVIGRRVACRVWKGFANAIVIFTSDDHWTI